MRTLQGTITVYHFQKNLVTMLRISDHYQPKARLQVFFFRMRAFACFLRPAKMMGSSHEDRAPMHLLC
jgi:hypothetical protein